MKIASAVNIRIYSMIAAKYQDSQAHFGE